MPALQLTINNTYNTILTNIADKIAKEMGNNYTKTDLLLDIIELQITEPDILFSSILKKYKINEVKANESI
jgi:hypothetical protein